MKTEMRRITGRRNKRGAEAKEKTRRGTNETLPTPPPKKQASFANDANDAAKLLPWRAYLMFRVRGEELQRADGEPELVRVRELPDAHAEGNQLVARDARRAFHDILADVIHALRV